MLFWIGRGGFLCGKRALFIAEPRRPACTRMANCSLSDSRHQEVIPKPFSYHRYIHTACIFCHLHAVYIYICVCVHMCKCVTHIVWFCFFGRGVGLVPSCKSRGQGGLVSALSGLGPCKEAWPRSGSRLPWRWMAQSRDTQKACGACISIYIYIYICISVCLYLYISNEWVGNGGR